MYIDTKTRDKYKNWFLLCWYTFLFSTLFAELLIFYNRKKDIVSLFAAQSPVFFSLMTTTLFMYPLVTYDDTYEFSDADRTRWALGPVHIIAIYCLINVYPIWVVWLADLAYYFFMELPLEETFIRTIHDGCTYVSGREIVPKRTTPSNVYAVRPPVFKSSGDVNSNYYDVYTHTISIGPSSLYKYKYSSYCNLINIPYIIFKIVFIQPMCFWLYCGISYVFCPTQTTWDDVFRFIEHGR